MTALTTSSLGHQIIGTDLHLPDGQCCQMKWRADLSDSMMAPNRRMGNGVVHGARKGLLPLDACDVEGDGEPLQIEFTAVTNVEVVGDRIDDGRCHKDLSSTGGGTDSGSFVDSLAQVVIAKVDSFSGVDTNAHLRSEAMLTTVIGQGALDRNGALDGIKGIGERYEEPISFMVDLPTVVRMKTLTQGTVVPVQ